MNIETSLHREIQAELELLRSKEVGSEEHKATVDSVTKLVDRAIEMEKLNIEHEDKAAQMKEDKKDRLIKNILTAAGIIIPTVTGIWGTYKTLKFEETGTITSMAGRNWVNKLFPKK